MVTCPDPIQVFVPEGMPSVVVNYADPMVSDDSGLMPMLVAAIGMPSGGLFPAGRQEVVAFQYADAAGNLGSCTLTITVTGECTVYMSIMHEIIVKNLFGGPPKNEGNVPRGWY